MKIKTKEFLDTLAKSISIVKTSDSFEGGHVVRLAAVSVLRLHIDNVLTSAVTGTPVKETDWKRVSGKNLSQFNQELESLLPVDAAMRWAALRYCWGEIVSLFNDNEDLIHKLDRTSPIYFACQRIHDLIKLYLAQIYTFSAQLSPEECYVKTLAADQFILSHLTANELLAFASSPKSSSNNSILNLRSKQCSGCSVQGCVARVSDVFTESPSVVGSSADYLLFEGVSKPPIDEIEVDDDLISELKLAQPAFYSDEVKRLLTKSAELFPGGRWENEVIMDYAIFLRELYRIAFKKGDRFNVRWNRLPLVPLANGEKVTPTQLTNAVRSMGTVEHYAKRDRFRAILLGK